MILPIIDGNMDLVPYLTGSAGAGGAARSKGRWLWSGIVRECGLHHGDNGRQCGDNEESGGLDPPSHFYLK